MRRGVVMFGCFGWIKVFCQWWDADVDEFLWDFLMLPWDKRDSGREAGLLVWCVVVFYWYCILMIEIRYNGIVIINWL